ncbi:MAG: hydroxymethylglutaryl-CoA lyase [Acidimicrobiia bacterium]|nr:hydroxymethylglutaryl-CoA lyase [Acidimicrobiia bacterium]
MAVTIIDVSPRDGLQNESALLSTDDKLALIARLVEAGLTSIEVTSFVNPRLVPAMADADEIMRRLPRHDTVRYIGLVLNERGMERAIEGGVDEANIVIAASDRFSEKNQGLSTFEGAAMAVRAARIARDAGIEPSITISTAFGCPFEGEVPLPRLVDVVNAVSEADPVRINLGDTIGVAVPTDVHERFSAVRPLAGEAALGAHFHNTRNTGYANAVAALAEGVTHFDASLGGIGGCPFAPNATGNVATDDLVYLFERMGVSTGLDLDAVLSGSQWLEGPLGKKVPALLPKAGPFPGRPATLGS